MNSKILSIGSDHGGFELKNSLSEALTKSGMIVLDRGPEGTESVDYPDFAKAVCDDVIEERADFGVLVCTTGIGMSIAANKIKGIRAALCNGEDAAKFSRLHNNANVVCFGQKYTPFETALKIVKIFSETQFEGGRHGRRVSKFMKFEEGDC